MFLFRFFFRFICLFVCLFIYLFVSFIHSFNRSFVLSFFLSFFPSSFVCFTVCVLLFFFLSFFLSFFFSFSDVRGVQLSIILLNLGSFIPYPLKVPRLLSLKVLLAQLSLIPKTPDRASVIPYPSNFLSLNSSPLTFRVSLVTRYPTKQCGGRRCYDSSPRLFLFENSCVRTLNNYPSTFRAFTFTPRTKINLK